MSKPSYIHLVYDLAYYIRVLELELELELIQTQMAQKPMLRAEVGMRNASNVHLYSHYSCVEAIYLRQAPKGRN